MAIIKAPTFKICFLSENVNFRNILAGKLRVDNFDVDFAEGGFHLLHILEGQKNNINMIIINEDMKDMSGYEIISLVRQIKTKTELPILFISKTCSDDELFEMSSIGANDYLVQSDNFKPIIERVQKYLKVFSKNVA